MVEGQGEAERGRDLVAALVAAVYLLLALAFFAWQLFDVWSQKYYFIQEIVVHDMLRFSRDSLVSEDALASGIFRSVAFATAGGGMGGAVNGIRSILQRHSDVSNPKRFHWRYAYIYAFLPPLGATLGMVAIALVQTGIGVMSGEATIEAGTGPAMSALAIGFLAGYGSGEVFVWLDARVSALFRPATISVPALTGLTRAEAQSALLAARLNLGNVTYDGTASAPPGTVVGQQPQPFSMRAEGSQVHVTIAGPAPEN